MIKDSGFRIYGVELTVMRLRAERFRGARLAGG